MYENTHKKVQNIRNKMSIIITYLKGETNLFLNTIFIKNAYNVYFKFLKIRQYTLFKS